MHKAGVVCSLKSIGLYLCNIRQKLSAVIKSYKLETQTTRNGFSCRKPHLAKVEVGSRRGLIDN